MSKTDLKRYNTILYRASAKTFPCPECKDKILPKKYEIHCTQRHKLNSKKKCVWCRGAESWAGGNKQRNVEHLISCFKTFMKTLTDKPPTSSPPETFVPFDFTPMCPPKDFFGREKIPGLPERAYGSVWPLIVEEPVEPLTFQDPNINLAASYVRYYLTYNNRIDVFHVMVKANIFPNFLEALDTEDGQTRTLEFSCWCDGGKHPIAKYRHHRHMILFSTPKGRFVKKVWDKIKTSDKPHANFKSKLIKRITCPEHLVNTMRYVSRRHSRCNFTFDRRLKKDNANHFHVMLAMPFDARICLFAQWGGGLASLLKEKLDHVDRKILVDLCKRVDGRWQIRVKDLPDVIRNLVLPVEKHFRPTAKETEYFLHLTETRKLYFEKFNGEEWIRSQVGGGNLFYHAVAEEYLIPRRKHQQFLTDVHTCIRNATDAKIAELSKKLEASVRENEKIKASLDSPRAELKPDINIYHIVNQYNGDVNKNLKTSKLEPPLF